MYVNETAGDRPDSLAILSTLRGSRIKIVNDSFVFHIRICEFVLLFLLSNRKSENYQLESCDIPIDSNTDLLVEEI
jgi:hypothetical protein